MGVEGDTEDTRLIALCYQFANPPKSKDKNPKG